MGITRSRMHKKKHTGAKIHIHQKKRKFELGRIPANTKLAFGERRVRPVRTMGGHKKWRALRLDTGNFSWGSEGVTRRVHILDVVYNSTNNELVRTKTLVKGCIVAIDANPFRTWYYKHYGVQLGRHVVVKRKGMVLKKKKDSKGAPVKKKKKEFKKPKVTKTMLRKWAKRSKDRQLDDDLKAQFRNGTGKLLAQISSRPGQVGRADGYILEGKELEFYQKKVDKKKKKV
eukprot:TRINITY_DN10225_c0_g1_i2.p2 TRINITY_DN10225_c0_g1~~TRINITY_DN10225_c0_g1_i2.p2  ORF type:complete len:230 (+),score=57.22 TRINITY_DN10225_c0_g1_i2:86-775(+)